MKGERATRPEPSEKASAPTKTGGAQAPQSASIWLGVAGVVLVAGSFAAAAFLGRSDDRLRSLLLAAASLGAALVTTLLPPLPRAALLGRLLLALGVAALIPVLDPLAFAYRFAAQARMHGDDATRRAAIADVMRIDRDFRGLSFAGASLPGVDLTAADLRRASFAGADLTGAQLYAAELYGASFADAELSGADLQGTQLHLADTSGARCDEATRLPPSWRCDGGRIGRTQPAGP